MAMYKITMIITISFSVSMKYNNYVYKELKEHINRKESRVKMRVHACTL